MKNPNFNISLNNFFDRQNLTAALNIILIYGIAAGACIVKLPQLLKIYLTKTVEGLSFMTVYLEILVGSSLLIFSYKEGINISLWIDVALINIQNILILLLMWMYSKKFSKFVKTLKVLLYMSYTFYLLHFAPPKVITLLGLVLVPMGCFCKIPQIYLNFKNKHTGNLSLITYATILGSKVARIFTVIFSTTNKIYLVNCIFLALINLTCVCQILYYWKNTKKVMDQLKIKKE